ncbi:MAG TPA: aminopeptidase P family protein, partial [Tissierellaceae bacterium]|nr:aminopeptidase P family protein [Tissierellaceae bacterium]
MKSNGISAYIIPTSDPHQSEYVADHYKARSWISGFTGSAGTVVVTQDDANLWTDGRYFIQAENQLKGSEYKLFKMGVAEVPSYIEWLKANIESGDTIGYDARVFSQITAEELEKEFIEYGINFNDKYDFVGEIWEDRPELTKEEAFVHELIYTGISSSGKIAKLRANMKSKGADYFLIASLDDIAWLFNIRGKDVKSNPVIISYALISSDRAYLFVDMDKINPDVESFLNDNGIQILSYEDVIKYVREIESDASVILEKDKINRWIYDAIPEECNIIDELNYTTILKGKKNHTEIENQKNAYIKDGVALTKFLYWLDKKIDKIEITELSAAEKLLEFRKEQDLFIEPSFNTISAYGPNAAMAHYSATKDSFSIIEKKGFYLVDSGGQYLDGTTDITRTVAVGPITDEEKKDFTLTLKGHINLINAKFLEGTSGYQLDILCRQPMWEEGLDFKHGTGHGIGYLLNVHEGPHRIASIPNFVALEKGMISSIEPGVYKAGKHGIRIENIAVVDDYIETESGKFMKFEVLSYVPIDLDAIDASLLSNNEIKWLNSYHKDVYEKLSPYLNEDENTWLQEKTRSIQ